MGEYAEHLVGKDGKGEDEERHYRQKVPVQRLDAGPPQHFTGGGSALSGGFVDIREVSSHS